MCIYIEPSTFRFFWIINLVLEGGEDFVYEKLPIISFLFTILEPVYF